MSDTKAKAAKLIEELTTNEEVPPLSKQEMIEKIQEHIDKAMELIQEVGGELAENMIEKMYTLIDDLGELASAEADTEEEDDEE